MQRMMAMVSSYFLIGTLLIASILAVAAILACCAACFIGCIEGLVEYFNRYAYIQIALYGSSGPLSVLYTCSILF
jgi:hypothetical protein